MDERITTILQDLYTVDPSLRSHEPDLKKVIASLIASRPAVQLDERFMQRLRDKVLAYATELKQGNHISETLNQERNFSMKKLHYILGGAVLAVLLIVPAIYFSKSGVPGVMTKPGQLLSLRPAITKVSNNAFGTLTVQQSGLGAGPAAPQTAQVSRGEAASDTAVSSPSMPTPAGFGGGGGVGVDAKMIAPYYYNYRYVYAGDPIKLDGGGVDVLKRIKGTGSNAQLSQFLQSFNISGINLGSFGDSTLQNLSFIQDKPFGYSIYVSLTDGTVSISENWEKWYPCTNGVCPQQDPLSPNDVPSDDAIISLAQKFVADHGIDTSSYGTPEVMNEWRVMYDRAPEASTTLYVPDVMTVTFPLIINGKEVYDEGGNKTGMHVNVNIRFKRVSGIYDFMTQNYQSSAYVAETDVDRILKIAEQGGLYGYSGEINEKTVDLKMGNPTVAYYRFWNYANGTSDELLTPALVFPVTAPEDQTGYFRKNVIVPLAKDLLDRQNQGGPPIMIMEKAQ